MFFFMIFNVIFMVNGLYSDWAKQRCIYYGIYLHFVFNDIFNLSSVRFANSFEDKCLQYGWVRDYIKNKWENRDHFNKSKNNKFAIFIFDDHHTRARKGGYNYRHIINCIL